MIYHTVDNIFFSVAAKMTRWIRILNYLSPGSRSKRNNYGSGTLAQSLNADITISTIEIPSSTLLEEKMCEDPDQNPKMLPLSTVPVCVKKTHFLIIPYVPHFFK
jgi:hypothetical protein